jgi:hypothetical protein
LPYTQPPTLAEHGGSSRDLAETVHTATSAVAKGSEGLRQWSAMIVSRRAQQLGLPGGTYLNEYLAIAKTRMGDTRRAVFGELRDFVNVSAAGV